MMTKPLLYTGLTRASKQVAVIGSSASFKLCLEQTTDSSVELARNTTLQAYLKMAEVEYDLEAAEETMDDDMFPC